VIGYFAFTYIIQLALIVPGYDWFYNADHDIKILCGSISWLVILTIYVVLISTSRDRGFFDMSCKIWKFYAAAAVVFIFYIVLTNVVEDFPLGLLCYIFYVGATPYGELIGFHYLAQIHSASIVSWFPDAAYIIISILVFLLCRFRLSTGASDISKGEHSD